jgi:histidyl-tRNA synthetase
MKTKNSKNTYRVVVRIKKSVKKKRSVHVEHDHLDKVGEIAVCYGFSPNQSPAIKKSDIDLSRSLLEGDDIDDSEDHARLPLHVEEKVALLRMYDEKGMHALPQPVMMYFKEPFKGSLKKSGYTRYADLEIIGPSRSIAEATLIQTAKTMLAEEGYENIAVEVNSIGDRDSISRFTRELIGYYRKNINEMSPECRQMLKRDPFELLSSCNEECLKINEGAPKPMSFLTEASRVHFREVLEYIEALGVPYRINDRLVGNRKYCTETVFSIINPEYVPKKSKDHRILAIGMRYDGLSKRIGMKKEVQGVGLSILIKGNKADLRKPVSKTKRPWASFVQLGFESKLLSLSVIESLRQVDIHLCLSLAKDRLSAQVSQVGRESTPYTVIMGKKEAVERNVIIRNMDTHAQETVSLDDLPNYMKRLEKKL